MRFFAAVLYPEVPAFILFFRLFWLKQARFGPCFLEIKKSWPASSG
jgi:hypothetical protein